MAARVLVADPLEQEGIERLRRSGLEVDYRPSCDRQELLQAVAAADALVVRSRVRVDAAVLEAGPRLRVVGRAGVGVDNVDVDAASRRGVLVVNVPDGNTVAAAEHTFALLLAVARHVVPAAGSLRSGRWERQRFVGVELRGKVLGVVGLGRIGREVAARARAFGMDVLAHDPYLTSDAVAALGARPRDLDALLAESDFVTLHVPLTPHTRGFIGRAQIARMKPGAFLVNCARGGLVDERALYEALVGGHLAGAALDVFAEEPPGDNPLLGLENVVATPHLGASTREAQVTVAALVADYVARVLAGEPVESAVNLPPVPGAEWERLRPLLRAAQVAGAVYAQTVGAPGDLEVRTAEPMSPAAGELVRSAALVGILTHVVDAPVNLVSAPHLAAERRIRSAWRPDAAVPEGAAELHVGPHRVGVALGPAGEVRLTHLFDLPVDVAVSPHMLVTRHRDRPGMVGRIGTVLGARQINIAGMQVGRRQVRGEAVLVMAVDDPVPDDVLAELRAIPDLADLRHVVLPPGLL
jgi:D-3-phosphoglycerate dehydrogenase